MENATLFWENLNCSELNSSLCDIDYPDLEILEYPFQIGLITVFTLTATFSLSGNITVIIVLSFGKRSSKDLRPFLINLAITDVLMAIFSIPFTYTMFLLGRWIFYAWFCPIVLAFQHIAVLASVYTLTAIGVDRYRAIVNPLNRRATKSRAKLILLVIWIISISIASIQFKVSWAKPFKYNREWHLLCNEHWESERNSQIYSVFIFVVSFLLPITCLIYTYAVVACKMWKRAMPGNADICRDKIQLRAKWKVMRMLLTVVILFFICWLPLQLFLLLNFFIPKFEFFYTKRERYIYALSYFTCLWLANANSFINPLIYSFMSENFRADVKEVFRMLCFCKSSYHYKGSVRSQLTRSTTYKCDNGYVKFKKLFYICVMKNYF